MKRKNKIGKGESSSIAVVYDEPSYIFATNDTRAIQVASDLLGVDQIVTCEEILVVLFKKDLLSKAELELVRSLIAN